MKLLILLSALALCNAQWGHQGAYHVPVIGPLGVPVDTPEVQHARAAHLAALGQAHSVAGPYLGQEGAYQGDQGQYNSHEHELRYHGPPAYPTTHGAAKVTPDGVPLETPEVAAAKAHHFSAFSEALSRNGPYIGHHRYRRSLGWAHGYHGYHVPVIGPHGVPIDTPEVQHARAAHLAALAAASHGHGAYGGVGGVYAGNYLGGGHYGGGAWAHGFQGLDHEGRPLDTPEVAHAKAAHFAAYNEAAHRNGVHGGVHGAIGPYGHLGAPIDTPEVQHAKAAHFAAHAAARAGHHGHYY